MNFNTPGGYSEQFCNILFQYLRYKEKHSGRFQFPVATTSTIKDRIRNMVRNHNIIIDSNNQILIRKKSYYQQNEFEGDMNRITRAKYRKLRSNHSCTVYKRDHFVKLLKQKNERKVFQQYHIINHVHKGITIN